jgi:hypothetical protein
MKPRIHLVTLAVSDLGHALADTGQTGNSVGATVPI